MTNVVIFNQFYLEKTCLTMQVIQKYHFRWKLLINSRLSISVMNQD